MERTTLQHCTSPEAQGAHNAIMFIEDERTLLQVATRMLERNGYVCHVASSMAEAVALFETHRATIGLAVIDYLLPDGTGTELIHHFRQARPDLPVILSSGISHAELHQHAAESHVEGILSKPYRSRDLLYAVQAVLPAPTLAKATI
ncbi:MAG: response regulator [Bacteroidota bacterium]